MDEAGNFDFSESGSRYLILTCVVMRRPFAHVYPLLSLKYDCLDYGVNQKVYRASQEFPATGDVNPVRNAVFSAIKAHAFGCRVYSAVLDKRALPAGSRAMVDVYALLFGWLVHNVRVTEEVKRGERVVAVTDVIKVKGKNEAQRAALKRHMKREFFSRGVEYLLYQHQSESDINLQLADYCCWAVQRKWEHGDETRYRYVEDMVALIGSPLEGISWQTGDRPTYP